MIATSRFQNALVACAIIAFPSAMWLAHVTPQPHFVTLTVGLLAGILLSRWCSRPGGVMPTVPDRVQQALDTFSEGLLLLDDDEQIVLANRAFAETVGLSQSELVGRPASSLSWVLPDGETREGFPWLHTLRQDEPLSDRRLQLDVLGGHQRVFSINCKPLKHRRGERRGALATFRDVTEVEEHRAQLESMLVMLRSNRDEISRKNRELEVLATQDSLTGCLNRRAFFEQFDGEWRSCTTSGRPLACIMIDSDHFKKINDTYGHHTGDVVLRRVAQTLLSLHAENELVCRYGGEEFCILLPDKDAAAASAVAETIRQEILALRFDEQELRLSASLGVSDLTFAARDPQELINQADKCLYVAKHRGRNQVVCYSPEVAEMEITESAESQSDDDFTPDIPYPAVTALLSALGYRDSSTAAHSRRVADLCAAAADGLLQPREIYVLEIAAQLHDIGKIGVPDDVLLSRLPLTNEQWKVMARHERLGVELVNETFDHPQLTAIVQNFRAHYGGGGRLSGLPTGNAIPLAARLLAIADSFDAMVSNHPYRAGRSYAEAFEELRACAGSQFDPQLVERFIAAIQARMATRPDGGFSSSSDQRFATQIQRLAEALDARDIEGIAALACHLRQTAEQAGVPQIAEMAGMLQQQATREDPELLQLIRLTSELLSLCNAVTRASQRVSEPSGTSDA